MPQNNGIRITNRDIYDKIEDLDDAFSEHREEVAVAFGKRPTRTEIMAVTAGAATFVGVVFSAVRFI
jgi:hypothetical protein